MDNIDIAKGLIFKNLNITNKDSLDNRVIIQKKIYLLQEQEVDLGYEYNWYLKGPYSPTLTNYVYDNLDVLNTMEYKGISLNSEVMKKVLKVNKLKDYKPDNLSEADWYELLASLEYISENYNAWAIDKDKEEIIKTLIAEKPKYSKEECEYAFEKLIEFEYLEVQ